MPIYEYQCRKCEHTLDALQKISEAPLVDCPECGQSSLKRLLSAPRFRLKGKGWYETDFKTGDKKNLARGDLESTAKSSESKSDDTSKTKKSDSKPAPKSGGGDEGKAA